MHLTSFICLLHLLNHNHVKFIAASNSAILTPLWAIFGLTICNSSILPIIRVLQIPYLLPRLFLTSLSIFSENTSGFHSAYPILSIHCSAREFDLALCSGILGYFLTFFSIASTKVLARIPSALPAHCATKALDSATVARKPIVIFFI